MARYLTWLFVIGVSTTIGFFLSVLFDFHWVSGKADGPTLVPISSLDLASLSMTAATIALAASALVVTLVGLVGARTIKSQATELARVTSKDWLEKNLDRTVDAALQKILPERMNSIMMDVGDIDPDDDRR